MVGFEVIDLFAEEQCPEVFAEEFYYIEWGLGARGGAGKSLKEERISSRLSLSQVLKYGGLGKRNGLYRMTSYSPFNNT